MNCKRKALFLDRDGVININHGYVHTPEKFEFINGIFELVRLAVKFHYLVIVITNQAGIGRGYYSEDQFHLLTKWMCDQFLLHGAKIESVYYCPFHPEHGVGIYKNESYDRKPSPGMILKAAREYDLNLFDSVLVGDNETDIQAGQVAGVGCNILYQPAPIHPISSANFHVVHDLSQILSFFTEGLQHFQQQRVTR